jgi:hypothetical protein
VERRGRRHGEDQTGDALLVVGVMGHSGSQQFERVDVDAAGQTFHAPDCQVALAPLDAHVGAVDADHVAAKAS